MTFIRRVLFALLAVLAVSGCEMFSYKQRICTDQTAVSQDTLTGIYKHLQHVVAGEVLSDAQGDIPVEGTRDGFLSIKLSGTPPLKMRVCRIGGKTIAEAEPLPGSSDEGEADSTPTIFWVQEASPKRIRLNGISFDLAEAKKLGLVERVEVPIEPTSGLSVFFNVLDNSNATPEAVADLLKPDTRFQLTYTK